MNMTVDRLENGKAVLINEQEQEGVIPADWIPHAREGMALRMEITEDPEREAKARAEAQALLNSLKRGK